MTDRELLEAAAKAAGMEVVPGSQSPSRGWYYVCTGAGGLHQDGANRPLWNPLTNDGDALRLAVKLGTSIDFTNYTQTVFYGVGQFIQEDWHLTNDPYAATRRAIVRAAAIGGAVEAQTTESEVK
jgi:hypothetical protein